MKTKRIIIKVGTNCLIQDKNHSTGTFDQSNIHAIFSQVKLLRDRGYQVSVVISGAVASGRSHHTLASRQAQAARGQWLMNNAIAQTVADINLPLGLLLLSREDLRNRQRYSTLQETFTELLDGGLVPLINENDATTVKHKNDFPDNDYLAALMAITVDAQALFLLTNVAGVFSDHPANPGALLIPEIDNVNIELLSRINATQSSLGRGGMLGKLTAARLTTATGIDTYILDGSKPEQISAILEHGARHGTHCKSRLHADHAKLSVNERWLIASKASDGSLQVDRGAAEALKRRKSLLAIGIQNIYGSFHAHEAVEVLDEKRETIAIGLTKFSSDELQTRLNDRAQLFGIEVIHTDNLILI